VAGAIIIVVVLLLIPVGVLIAGGLAAAALGSVLTSDGKARNEGSELIDLNR
jgi:hypothetical protein